MPIFKGKEITLSNNRLNIGMIAPNFNLLANDFSIKTLDDYNGKKKLISVIPSIDTGVCDLQTRQFNALASKMENTVVITVSADLPFAQIKWCGTSGIDAITLSDYFDGNFGKAYGVYMNEFHLLNRSIFVIDEQNIIQYVEYLEDNHKHPNYENAINALKSIK